MIAPLKMHRERKRLSTRELAKEAGIAADTVWRIEGGDFKNIRPATQRKLAAALGVNPDDIAEFHIENNAAPVNEAAEREALIANARRFGIALGSRTLAPLTVAELAEVDARAQGTWYSDDPDGTGLWSEERVEAEKVHA